MTTADKKKSSKKTTKFYARGHGQRVTLKSPEVRYDERGNRIETGGEVAEFENGFWETDDSDLVDIMREREGFNLDFFEEGNEPGALKPSEPDALNAIVEATAAQDAGKIDDILREEKATHNRPNVIGAASTAVVNVRKAIESGVPEREGAEEGAIEMHELDPSDKQPSVESTGTSGPSSPPSVAEPVRKGEPQKQPAGTKVASEDKSGAKSTASAKK